MRRPSQLDPVSEVSGWTLGNYVMSEIDRIVRANIRNSNVSLILSVKQNLFATPKAAQHRCSVFLAQTFVCATFPSGLAGQKLLLLPSLAMLLVTSCDSLMREGAFARSSVLAKVPERYAPRLPKHSLARARPFSAMLVFIIAFEGDLIERSFNSTGRSRHQPSITVAFFLCGMPA